MLPNILCCLQVSVRIRKTIVSRIQGIRSGQQVSCYQHQPHRNGQARPEIWGYRPHGKHSRFFLTQGSQIIYTKYLASAENTLGKSLYIKVLLLMTRALQASCPLLRRLKVPADKLSTVESPSCTVFTGRFAQQVFSMATPKMNPY
jgi:hypothetical protein